MLRKTTAGWILALALAAPGGCDGDDATAGDSATHEDPDVPGALPDAADVWPGDGTVGDTSVPSGDTDMQDVTSPEDADARDAADPDVLQDTTPDADGQGGDADAGPDAVDGGSDADAEGAQVDVQVDVAPPPPVFHPGDFDEDAGAFPLAVQAADARPDGARLWTRYLGAAPLRVVVFTDGSPITDGVLHREAEVIPAAGGFVQVDVDGLEAGTWYRYAFLAGEADEAEVTRSAVGRFRTAFEADAEAPVVFGAVSCIDKGINPFAPLEQASFDDLDFFLMAGDTVYADGAVTLEDYRAVWHEWYAEEEFRKLHASTSFLYTWDDHETENNWDPETLDPGQVAAARQAFFEFGALGTADPQQTRIWRSFRWGRTLEVFVLDCRSERKPSQDQYISPEQMAWLKQGLLASEATFKVILNSVPFSDMPPVLLTTWDRWEGYPAQREEVMEVLHQVDGVLWVSGDFHFGSIGGIEPPGEPLSEVREVLTGPGAKLPNPLWAVVANGPYADQFQYLTGTNNYVRFIAEPQADPPTITVEFVDGSGDVIHSEPLWF